MHPDIIPQIVFFESNDKLTEGNREKAIDQCNETSMVDSIQVFSKNHFSGMIHIQKLIKHHIFFNILILTVKTQKTTLCGC